MPLYEKRGLTRAGQGRGVAVIFLHPERKKSHQWSLSLQPFPDLVRIPSFKAKHG